MQELLQQLKNILVEEQELEDVRKPIAKRLKELKEQKLGLAEKFLDKMKTDNYSTDFATIMRGRTLVIDILNEQEASEYIETEIVKTINEAKVQEVFEAMYRDDSEDLQGADFDGLHVQEVYKPTIRRKKNGFDT